MGIPIPFLNDWLTDFVYVPIVLYTLTIGAHVYIGPRRASRFSLTNILIICCFVSLIFEGVMPRATAFYIYDPIDIAMYFSGGIFYYFTHQPIVIKRLQAYLDQA